MNPITPPWILSVSTATAAVRVGAVETLNDPKALRDDRERAASAFASTYEGVLSEGGRQLLERKAVGWINRSNSEVLERKRDGFLAAIAEKEPLVGNRIGHLAEQWRFEEEHLRGLPFFSAQHVHNSDEEQTTRLWPTPHPDIARLLVRETLWRHFEVPGALHLVARAASPDVFAEGLMVFLSLASLSYPRPGLEMCEFLEENEAYLTPRCAWPGGNESSPYRSADPHFEDMGLRSLRWLLLDPPFSKRWINLPPHKIQKIDEERHALQILIAERNEEEYELTWYPSKDDWKGVAGKTLLSRQFQLDKSAFYFRFGKAYHRHETLRPLETALDAAWRTLQICLRGRERPGSLGDLARELREDLYDLLNRHGSGSDFLNHLAKSPALLQDARQVVARWLPLIRAARP